MCYFLFLGIDIEIFLKFNKLRTLTTDLNDVIKALRKSEMIQVSEDGRKVCRITPFGEKQDVDACTIYVVSRKLCLTFSLCVCVCVCVCNLGY